VNRQVAGAASGLFGLAALAAWLVAGPDGKLAPRAAADRTPLALVTSLPLIFGESFSLEGGGSPALARLEQRYEVQPIGVADAPSLNGHKLLLMAHPRAQSAEALVELDQWVRDGGRLLLLADPRLTWHSELALGHSLRPPPAFADTGLLSHWGLTLAGPSPDGPAEVGNGERSILASAPGKIESRGNCSVAGKGFVARCRLGKGQATVIADADFLHVGGEGALDGPTEHNLDLLLEELERLESR
jgi:hypothetical protein